MRASTFLLSCASIANGHRAPGAWVSLSGDVLSRGSGLVPTIVDTLKDTVIPGQNATLFWVEPIRFADVHIDEYDVSVVPNQGVQVSLKGMSNELAHTRFEVHDLFNWIRCSGTIWASATGASYTAMNTLEVDEDGRGKLVVTTPEGGFNAGTIEIHHQMDSRRCERLADVVHLVDSALINIITAELSNKLAGVIADAVGIPANKVLGVIEYPPALGLGKEKFQLDNSFVSVNYNHNRITHYNVGQFKSTVHPEAVSALTPPDLDPADKRDLVFGFSDYVLNTLFESMYAEHIGEEMVVLPFVKTLFDKECHRCALVIKSAFAQRGQQSFMGGLAVADFRDMVWEIGALQESSGTETVLPMVQLKVNASLGITFELQQTADNAALKAQLSLQNFEQELMLSFVGELDMSDLTRDVYMMVVMAIGNINSKLPALEIPTVAGMKMANEKIIIDNRELRVETDVVMDSQTMLV